MNGISKIVYIDKLDDIVNKWNKTYHRTIKIKPVHVKPSMYIAFEEEKNKECPEIKVGDNVRVSKNKNIFAKGCVPTWSEEVFVIKKVKNTLQWAYFICDSNGEEILGTFFEREFQKTNQKESKVEKVIKRKGDKLYVKWENYYNFFINWTDKKDIV